ncbi:MAG: terpene cyclase/mutase family protein [Chloroflexi bacterium]|nr:terpene cyclase/mutase family protein [Chloroflexota bacterium]
MDWLLFEKLVTRIDDRPARSLDEHLQAALGWLQRASQAVEGQGISKGYDLLRSRWFPAYPETTGYTVPTLINAARILNQEEWRAFAHRQAEFLLGQVTEEGGVVYWDRQGGQPPLPVVFDTGQVLFGWLAAYRDGGDRRFLEAAARSGDWLVRHQDEAGMWKKYQHLGVYKVIDARVAWALLELHRLTTQTEHKAAALRHLDWVLAQQDADGWYRHCAFTPQEDPFTHTIAYTAEGLYRSGELLGEERYIAAGQKTADRLLQLQRADGSLASTYASGWRASDSSSCLTGNAQMSDLWQALWLRTGQPEYQRAADKSLEFVRRTQDLSTPNRDVRGGISGSHPIYGRYERFKYPEWAAKFFIDAILRHKAAETGRLDELLPG